MCTRAQYFVWIYKLIYYNISGLLTSIGKILSLYEHDGYNECIVNIILVVYLYANNAAPDLT